MSIGGRGNVAPYRPRRTGLVAETCWLGFGIGFVCAWFICAADALAQTTTPTLEQFVSSPPEASLPAARIVGRDLIAREGQEGQRARAQAVAGPAAANGDELRRQSMRMKSIVEVYENKKWKDGVEGKLLDANNLMVSTIVAASLAAAAPTGGASLVIGGFTAITAAGLGYVSSEFQRQSEEAARRALGTAIANHIKDRGLDDLSGLNPEQILDRLAGSGHPVLDPNLERLQNDPQAVAIADSQLMKVLARTDIAMMENLKELAAKGETNAAAIQDTQKQVAHLSKTFADFTRDTDEKFVKLNNTMNDVVADLKDVNDRVQLNTTDIARNTEDIAFLQDAMYGKMSRSEQRAFLEAGALDSRLSPEEKAHRLDLAKKAEKREELVEDLGNFVDGAGAMMKIASNLGVEVPPEVRDTVNKGTQVASAVLAFSTGNYLGAVVAVSGLFGGGGGPDRAAVRHQQVMAQLANLRAGIEDLKRGQDEIKGMIAQLDENDRKIMQNQRAPDEAVVDLSEQVARSARDPVRGDRPPWAPHLGQSRGDHGGTVGRAGAM